MFRFVIPTKVGIQEDCSLIKADDVNEFLSLVRAVTDLAISGFVPLKVNWRVDVQKDRKLSHSRRSLEKHHETGSPGKILEHRRLIRSKLPG